MKASIDNHKLTIFPEGRIDSANAPQVEEEITSIRKENPHDRLVLDLEKIQYLSSAGLRIILRLRKAVKDLELIDVSSEVYEILEMTGFTEMLPVKKAYRKLSVDGCEVIGEGSNGIVYRYTDDIIIKVYKNNDALDDIHRERELARTALVLGVNTAIPYDVVKVGDKYGSVFELLSARSLTKLILADSDHIDEYIKIFADMLREIHATEVREGTLPDTRALYLDYADFLADHIDSAHYEKLKSLIDAVPYSDHMIHGDYHTNNIHYSNGEAILIDMDTLAVGNPVFEFASIFNAYVGFDELYPGSMMSFFKMPGKMCAYIYNKLLSLYYSTENEAAILERQDKIRLLGYTKLLRRTIRRDPENTEGIQMLKDRLLTLIDRTESLT